LRTGGNNLYGLLNQASFLFRHGAASFQCTLHSPAIGTKVYEKTLNSGIVIRSVGSELLPEAYMDGNHVVATTSPRPVRLQLNMLMAYARFYNPMNLATLFVRPSISPRLKRKRILFQLAGMVGLIRTAVLNIPWLIKLSTRKLKYWRRPPEAKFPMRHLGDQPGKDQQVSPSLYAPGAQPPSKPLRAGVDDSPARDWAVRTTADSAPYPPHPLPPSKPGLLPMPLVVVATTADLPTASA
jgi:hypothetical protein